jgi:propionyl-CoA carboxylase alpha chain
MKKILIANRGEIAIRVMKTARKMGIQTVAVYSEADREALHVRYADEAVCIGKAPSSESYLVQERIIEVAKKMGADAIHPGYGFLSENSAFALKAEKAGITFIGPSAHAIDLMGSKLAAKKTVADYGVPLVPGTDSPITDLNLAKEIAVEVGFPLLIKASAGGGGKGMRIVNKLADFEEQMGLAVSEATSAFGDGSVFIEKYVTQPRHIEIQILGDKHGNVVYIFERECSVQRRHQKVVEEAPSAVVTPEMRKAMGEAAVKVAKSCNYHGAGTVEFIVDESLNFYFLEMNTRLQVEHPVTEMISGLDLVEWQIRIARGEKLGFSQEELKIQGHAIELRVYAEDPNNNFLPDIGTLNTYELPVGDGVRVDNGYEKGMTIPIYYDPLISKLVVYGKTRQEAIEKMIKAIEDYHIEGVATTLSFGDFVMKHPDFYLGDFNTQFVEKYWHPNQIDEKESEIAAAIAALAFYETKNKVVFEEEGNLHKSSSWQIQRTK